MHGGANGVHSIWRAHNWSMETKTKRLAVPALVTLAIAMSLTVLVKRPRTSNGVAPALEPSSQPELSSETRLATLAIESSRNSPSLALDVESSTTAGDASASAPPKVEAAVTHNWAGFDPRAESNARGRVNQLQDAFEQLGSPTLQPAARAALVNVIAHVCAFVEMDYTRDAQYLLGGPEKVPLGQEAGYYIIANGGAMYRIPVGRFPLLDATQGFYSGGKRSSNPWSDPKFMQEDLNSAYEHAIALLAPYH
jgi:hypothetical protein